MLGKIFKNWISVSDTQYEVSGRNIQINNGEVFVDGKKICGVPSNNTRVVIYGDVGSVECTGSVEVSGNCGEIDCGGSCNVNGNVSGNVDAGGSVTCGNVSGDIDAGGSVRCKRF